MKQKNFITIFLSFFIILLLSANVLAVTNDAVESWSFNDGATPLGSDGSGGLTLNDIGGATRYQQGGVNYAYDLDGVNDYFNSTDPLTTFNGDRTYSFWINVSSNFVDTLYALSHVQDNGVNGVQIDFYYDGTNAVIRWVRPGLSAAVASYTVSLNDNTFHHVIVDYTSGGDVHLYLDNVLRGTVASTGTGNSNYDAFNIGSRTNQKFWDGGIDQFILYDRVITAAERTELYNSGVIYDPYYAAPTPPAVINNFSTIGTGAFSFETPVTIGSTWGIVNSVIGTSENAAVPFYFASSFTTYGSDVNDAVAECRITVDGTELINSTRTITQGLYGNFKIITDPVNLTLGNHTVNTECRKTSTKGYTVNNSQLTFFHLLDHITNESIEYLNINNPTGYSVTTSDNLLSNFNFTTTNTTNTTNLNNVIVHGRASYTYDQDGDITTYLKNEETGEICGNYTRGGTSGSTGSLGTTCLFENLNSTTTYNFGFYGFTSTGTGSVTDLLMNVYEIKTNETAVNTIDLNAIIPSNTTTTVATINITNILGGTYNVFVDAGIMVNSDTTQDAYFYLENTAKSIDYYRSLPSTGTNGNVNGQFVFTESGTSEVTYTLKAFCPSGCNISGGDFTAFVSDSQAASTGLFDINAYNVYNNTAINIFNASVGGTTYTTTNGTITALGSGTSTVTILAKDFFSNSTSHDTTINLNASLKKYVEITAYEVGSGTAINNFTVNTSSDTVITTNGVAYLPITTPTTVSFNSDLHAGVFETVNSTQFFNFTAYAQNSLSITFKDSSTDLVINNVSMDYFSDSDSNTVSTTNGTLYLTLLNPESYTFRINSTGYSDNLYFTTIVDDTHSDLTVYLNPNVSITTITVEIVDGGAAPVEAAIVKALKYYVSDNTYRVVASGITNPDGELKINLLTGSEFYKFVVVVNDVTVKTTSPFIITGTTVRIQVLLEEDILETFKTWRTITSTMVFNELTDSFRFDFSDGNNINREVCMSTYRNGVLTDVLINTTCVTGSSGTILQSVLNVSGLTYYSIATTTISGEEITLGEEMYSFYTNNIGSSGLLGQIILTILLSLSGFLAVELLLIMAPLSIILGGLAGMHTLSLTVTVPLLIIGVIIMFVLRRNG